MPDIPAIGSPSASAVDRVRETPVGRVENRPSSPPDRPGDRVELSPQARSLDHGRTEAARGSDSDRIAGIRDAIATGAYETDGKLDLAIERLMGELDR